MAILLSPEKTSIRSFPSEMMDTAGGVKAAERCKRVKKAKRKGRGGFMLGREEVVGMGGAAASHELDEDVEGGDGANR
jgi:hypothetical protein